MPRIYSDAGEQLAWIGEAIGDDVETYAITDVRECNNCGNTVEAVDDGYVCATCDRDLAPCQCAPSQRMRYTRNGVTWELTARRVDDP